MIWPFIIVKASALNITMWRLTPHSIYSGFQSIWVSTGLLREGSRWDTYFSHCVTNLLPSIVPPSNFLLIYGEIIKEPRVEKTLLISKSRREPQSGRR